MSSHHRSMHYALNEGKCLLHKERAYQRAMTTPNERLRQARLRHFRSATDAANAMSVPVGTYAGHENGHRGFPASRAPVYARRFGVTAEWLLYGKGAGPIEDAPAETSLLLPVSLPSAEALTRMFETMLEPDVPAEQRDALAQTLARRLPSGLARAALSPPVAVRGSESAPGGDAQDPAKRRLPRQPEQRT